MSDSVHVKEKVVVFLEAHKIIEILLTLTGFSLSVVGAVGGVVKPIPRTLIVVFGMSNLVIGLG